MHRAGDRTFHRDGAFEHLPHENLPQAEFPHAQAEVVVFGQGFDVEELVVAVGGEHRKGPAAVGAAHPGRGHGLAQDFPDEQVAGVVFRELVGIVAGREFPPGRNDGEDRQLHHVDPGNEVVAQLEIERVYQVLGVVHGKDFEADVVFLFVDEHALVHPVETVRLVGGTVLRADDALDVAIGFPGQVHLALGLRIVGVGADENAVVAVVDGPDGVVEHAPDDGRFVPAGDHDGHRLFRRGQELFLGEARVFAADDQEPVGLPDHVDDVDKQFVQTADHEDDAEADQQHL